jgi:perosamine synthetase
MATELAIDGGPPAIRGSLQTYNSLDEGEQCEVAEFLCGFNKPLSSYLAGMKRAAKSGRVYALEEHAAQMFSSKHVIACNSATSGLFAACIAAEAGPLGAVSVPALSMSATAAVPKFIGARLNWCDVDCDGIADPAFAEVENIAAIVTDLFGFPANFAEWRQEHPGIILIEDAAQAVLAERNGKYAGTLGNIGVLSFNVHKQCNAGEGGLILTDNDEYADAMRNFINHGEANGSERVGLNLRMTELTAVIALEQLRKAPSIILNRRKLYGDFCNFADDNGFPPPLGEENAWDGVYHGAYCFAFTVPAESRDRIANAFQAEGLPCLKGYPPGPLYLLPAFGVRDTDLCPHASYLHETMIVIELCRFDPSSEQIEQIGEAFHKVGRLL